MEFVGSHLCLWFTNCDLAVVRFLVNLLKEQYDWPSVYPVRHTHIILLSLLVSSVCQLHDAIEEHPPILHVFALHHPQHTSSTERLQHNGRDTGNTQYVCVCMLLGPQLSPIQKKLSTIWLFFFWHRDVFHPLCIYMFHVGVYVCMWAILSHTHFLSPLKVFSMVLLTE